jgi:quinol monooxygenase YgiN
MAFVVAAIWNAKPGEEEKIRDVIKTMTPLSRKEPGNLYYQAQVSPQNPTKFFLYEQYTSAQAYEDHRATEHFQKHIVGYALALLTSREVATYETIDV